MSSTGQNRHLKSFLAISYYDAELLSLRNYLHNALHIKLINQNCGRWFNRPWNIWHPVEL